MTVFRESELEEPNGGKQNKKCGSKSNNKQKTGRKPRWSQVVLDDFIDIIVSSDQYKKKLIFQNVKCQQNAEIYGKIREELKKRCSSRGENLSFTVDQLRSKFKKCVSECKRAALTIKTGTGIKRFQEDKSYGSWFQKLYEVIKTRDSCQPDQAIEPRAISSTPTVPSEDTSESEASSANQSNVFVPIKQAKRKSNRDDPICEALKLMNTIAEKDPSKELINFMKEDVAKAREHELRLMQMILSFGNQQPSWAQSRGSAVGNLGYIPPGSSVNDGFSPHHAPAPHQSQQRAFAPESTIPQGVLNYHFRPISPSIATPAPVNSNISTPSPLSGHESSTYTASDSPIYHSF